MTGRLNKKDHIDPSGQVTGGGVRLRDNDVIVVEIDSETEPSIVQSVGAWERSQKIPGPLMTLGIGVLIIDGISVFRT